MKNITVSMMDDLALKLRVEAANADMSVSRFLSQTLERALFGEAKARVSARIGAGAGEFEVPDSIDASNAEVAHLFGLTGVAPADAPVKRTAHIQRAGVRAAPPPSPPSPAKRKHKRA